MCPEWAAAMESMARPRASLAAVAREVLVSASTAVAFKKVGYVNQEIQRNEENRELDRYVRNRTTV